MATTKTFQRKKLRSRQALEHERRSPLRMFFTGGVELEDAAHPLVVGRLVSDFFTFLESWDVHPAWGQGVELKIRRLGQHRAEGLYYPEPPVLVVDWRSPRSLAHELAHLMDYRVSRALGGRGVELGPSSGLAFQPFHAALVARLRAGAAWDGRLSPMKKRLWRYLTSPSECFARAFEQCVAETLPEPCSLARTREEYRRDPLFLAEPPLALLISFRGLAASGGALRLLPSAPDPSRMPPSLEDKPPPQAEGGSQ